MHPLIALYKNPRVNRLKDSAEILGTIDLHSLCDDYHALISQAPRRHQVNKRYFVGHTGFPSGKTASNRTEEHLAIALANESRFADHTFALPCGSKLKLIDYQLPLKARGSDKGIGKVDLVGIRDDNVLTLVELKVLNRDGKASNSPLQAFLEILAYSAIVKANLKAIKTELQSPPAAAIVRDKLLICVIAPANYWVEVWSKTNVPSILGFAERVCEKLSLEVRFLSLTDLAFEPGSFSHRPKLTQPCQLKQVEASLPVEIKPETYQEILCDRLWNYAETNGLLDEKILDRAERSTSRPPVLLRDEVTRNLLLPPDCDEPYRRQVFDSVPVQERHRWFGSMKSSQALAQSIFGNLVACEKTDTLAELKDDDGQQAFFPEVGSASFALEHSVDRLNEPRPTSIDVWVKGARTVAVECKLTESGFGTCSRPRLDPQSNADYCDGTYRLQLDRNSRCALTELGIHYWRYIPVLFDWAADSDMTPCEFGNNYQLVRNVLAACVNDDGSVAIEGRHALVLYDERNPAFQTGGAADNQWHRTKEALRHASLLRRCSWQRLAALLAAEPETEWLAEGLFEKYGIEPARPQKKPRSRRPSNWRDSIERDAKVGRLIISEEDALNWLGTIDHTSCKSALRSGAWEVNEGVARPKSILWLDCWARTGMTSEKAKIQAMHAFESIFGIEHRRFARKIDHEFARRYRTSYDDSFIYEEIREKLNDKV